MRFARGLMVAAAAILAAGALAPSEAQAPEEERAVLDIPDSLVIPGTVRYERQTRGRKRFAYYGPAFPIERRDEPHTAADVSTLPSAVQKRLYPTPVRHGAARIAEVEAWAQHYGNLTLGAHGAADWKGILLSGYSSLGGGRAHLSDAGWHHEQLGVAGRQLFSLQTALDGRLKIEAGRTGIYDNASTGSHRNFYQVKLDTYADHLFASDHHVRLGGEVAQRGVTGPEGSPSEQVMLLSGDWERASGRFWIGAHGRYDVVHTGRPVGDEGTATSMVIGAGAWTRLDENWGGALGVDVYSLDYLGGDSLKTLRPTIHAWARVLKWLKFAGHLTSGAERTGIWEAYHDNPMLNLATPMRTPFRSLDLDLNTEFILGSRTSLTGGLRQLLIKNYPVWRKQASTDVNYEVGQFVLDYGYAGDESASITALYAQYHFDWTSGSLDVLGLLRTTNLKERPVPFVPDWEGHVTSRVPMGRDMTISPGLGLYGPRSYLLPGSSSMGELGSYAVMSVDFSMPVYRDWVATLSLNNLIHQQYERWNDVKEPGFHLQVAVRKTF